MIIMTPELREKAKQAKTAAELYALAKGEGFELAEDEAAFYYKLINGSGELADEELDNVAGGGCNANDGRLVVTVGYDCDKWVCKKCGSNYRYAPPTKDGGDAHVCNNGSSVPYVNCNSCKYMTYERGLWLCNNPANGK